MPIDRFRHRFPVAAPAAAVYPHLTESIELRSPVRAVGGAPYDRETWWCPHCQPEPGPAGAA